MVSGQPDAVFLLIHGTFGCRSEFAFPDSFLAEALKARITGSVVFRRFEWDGFNSHECRLRAAKDLVAVLENQVSEFPSSRHFIIAHSHGGNVAGYALKESAVAKRVARVYTLATPFICARPRWGEEESRRRAIAPT
ncbi:MAG: alpha/beta fold hydrolase [Zoogloeaceae bacterium]|nr:alpha/beta fold hydrolase [Zoogloeaceae bacterium]